MHKQPDRVSQFVVGTGDSAIPQQLELFVGMSLTVTELLDKALDQRSRGRLAEALVSAIAATELEPDNADAWWQVSLNRWMLGDAKLAVIALERTVELAPHYAPAWARLGTARVKNGDKSDAFQAFKTALDRDTNDRGGVAVRPRHCRRTGRRDDEVLRHTYARGRNRRFAMVAASSKFGSSDERHVSRFTVGPPIEKAQLAAESTRTSSFATFELAGLADGPFATD